MLEHLEVVYLEAQEQIIKNKSSRELSLLGSTHYGIKGKNP